MLSGRPKILKLGRPAKAVARRTVLVSLTNEDFRQASIAAKDVKQTVAKWIADMVYTSTQP